MKLVFILCISLVTRLAAEESGTGGTKRGKKEKKERNKGDGHEHTSPLIAGFETWKEMSLFLSHSCKPIRPMWRITFLEPC